MKRTLITSTALLLTGALLLSGCTEGGSSSAPGAGLDSSLTSSENSVSDVSSESSLVDSSSESTSSTDVSESVPSRNSSDTANSGTPLSFTEDDKELQAILKEILDGGAREVQSWFLYPHVEDYILFQKIRFSDQDTYYYYLIPENYYTDKIVAPITYAEMEKALGRFFTQRAVERYMSFVRKGTVTGETDGVIDVVVDDYEGTPLFLEVNGRLYHMDQWATYNINIDCETARIIAKTDNVIEFTYLYELYDYKENTEYKNEEKYPEYSRTTYILKEDGVWKLPYWSPFGFDQLQQENQ